MAHTKRDHHILISSWEHCTPWINFYENVMLAKSKVTIVIFLLTNRSKVLLNAHSASGPGQITWHTSIPSLVQLCELGMMITSILAMKTLRFSEAKGLTAGGGPS